jgi:pyruvate ferredoxin oxidoreductase gamma subunit
MRAPNGDAAHVRFEVRIHGRGGQGVVTAAELMSIAAFDGGRHAQAFPSFGSERTGAPVVAFCRISDRPIRTRAPITTPDAVIVQDPTLLHQVDVFAGLRPDGWVLINTTHRVDELGLGDLAQRLLPIPATDIARRCTGRPLPNAVLLGAFAAIGDLIAIDAVADAIRDRFPAKVASDNVAAAREAYALVHQMEAAHA